MKRTILSLLIIAGLVPAIGLWTYVAAQVAPAPPDVPPAAVEPPLPRMAAPTPPALPTVAKMRHSTVPAQAPQAYAYYGTGGGDHMWVGANPSNFQGGPPQIPMVPWFLDPKTAELAERYNQLEQQVLRLATAFRQADQDKDKREKLQQQITELTSQQFQLRHEVRQIEVKRLEKQLAQLQAQLERREQQKEKIIQRRVAQLTSQDDELRWEPLTLHSTTAMTPQSPYLYGQGTRGGWVSPVDQLPPLLGRVPHAPSAPSGEPPSPHASAPQYIPQVEYTDSLVPYPIVPQHRQPAQPTDSSDPFASDPTVPRHAPSPITEARVSLIEAKTRLEIAERELARVKAQYEAGLVQNRELARAEDEFKLNTIRLEETRRDHALRVRMLELDVQKAEAELEEVQGELEALKQLGSDKQTDPAIAAQIRTATFAIQKKQVEVERVKATLQRELEQAEREKPTFDPNAR